MPREYQARSRQKCKSCFIDDNNLTDDDELSASVGEGGRNQNKDVLNVQQRLNSISSDDGGPYQPLAEDGICGPKTKWAIKHFQQRYWQELLGDGRIDPGKVTWKKLVTLSDAAGNSDDSNDAPDAKKKPKKKIPPAPPPIPSTLMIALWLTQYRIYEAIKAIDVSITEFESIYQQAQRKGGNPSQKFMDAYLDEFILLKELPTFNRCFHIVSQNTGYSYSLDVMRKVRKIYTYMLDVMVATMFTTAGFEKTGEKKFVRVMDQKKLDKLHPGGALADAMNGGWWKKNANIEHIRVGSDTLKDKTLPTTLIHEMSHFVSDSSTFVVGSHVSGEWNDAFHDTHRQAVKNAYCYEWYALLASFKHLRPQNNDDLDLE